MSIELLQQRTREAADVLTLTHRSLEKLQIVSGERSATAVPLVIGSLDMAESIMNLLLSRPERSWVACLSLQRSQIEFVMRAAFFAKAASEQEVRRFRTKGKMPKRGKNPIFLCDLVKEAAQHLDWDADKLWHMVRHHQRELSSAVHGGYEVVGIYSRNEEWGDITIPWVELFDHLHNIVIFLQLGLGVAASFATNPPQQLKEILVPTYQAAHEFLALEKPEV